MSFNPSIAGKRRYRAHRRRFARTPRFLNRAGLKSRGRRDDLRNTLCAISSNAFDSMLARSSRVSTRADVAGLESKFLNNRTESREYRSVTNLRTLKNFFTNSLRWIAAKPIFPNACRRYGDKWLAKRRFSRFFFRVTRSRYSPSKIQPDRC